MANAPYTACCLSVCTPHRNPLCKLSRITLTIITKTLQVV